MLDLLNDKRKLLEETIVDKQTIHDLAEYCFKLSRELLSSNPAIAARLYNKTKSILDINKEAIKDIC